MKYYHVDVFAPQIFRGNGLTAVFAQPSLSPAEMLSIAQEFKQFETVFIFPKEEFGYPIRIFTVQEELEFAGHPALGAAAILHKVFHGSEKTLEVVLLLGDRKVELRSTLKDGTAEVVMNQGQPQFVAAVAPAEMKEVLSTLSLSAEDLSPGFPVEVVSTGLPYLLVPIRAPLENVRIRGDSLESQLSRFGAKFAYIFDTSLECRTWDNTGRFEDVATGSAAGPLIAYLVKNGFRQKNETVELHQGRFVGRPSVIRGRWSDTGVLIEGAVSFFAEGVVGAGSPAAALD